MARLPVCPSPFRAALLPDRTHPPPNRFNPVFVLPVCETLDVPSATPTSIPLSRTPGRRTGTGSAALSSPPAGSRTPTPRVPIAGFRRVGLLRMLAATGHLPLLAGTAKPVPLEDIRACADRPVVVFPEGTTSNGRALLRFAEVFSGVKLPVMKYKVFVMCVRCVFCFDTSEVRM